ncbi:unnamed protein product [Caenorhabditis brenneri]
MTSNTGIVKLNIGGTIFQTTRSTLTKFDGFFKTMFETNVPVTTDNFGAFFIDRDPTHFRLILNFMRDGDVELPTCKKEIKEISNEAQYYLLNGLVKLCSKQSEVQPNTEMFKVLHSNLEVFHAMLHSKKPVVVISLASVYYLFDKNIANDWKQFIERHSLKWNFFFKEAEWHQLLLYVEGKETVRCYIIESSNKLKCGRPWTTTVLDHLAHHMSQLLEE